MTPGHPDLPTDRLTDFRTEVLAGITTFLTMSYIIFIQPAVLSGRIAGMDTGMDFGAVTTATCLAAAFATTIMGAYARYPIALAPGMGQNFFFLFTAIPVAAIVNPQAPWKTALGAVFVAGVLFLVMTVLRVRDYVLKAVSPSMTHAIAVGIGLFIAFIGLRNAGLVIDDPGTLVKMNPNLASADVVVFVVGFLVAAVLYARKVTGAIVLGIAASFVTAIALKSVAALSPAFAATRLIAESTLATGFHQASAVVAVPPSISPTLLQIDVIGALSATMLPVVIMFLFMDVFDTMGTLIGVTERAGLTVDGKLPRMEKAMMADAAGTVAGSALGTSTVTSYIESAAGVEQGGRTGMTALVVAGLFLLAPFFYPLIEMVGSYPPVTAPALVLVGALMVQSVRKIDWNDVTEGIPAFITIVCIPVFHSIADGLSFGLVVYPAVKGLSGKHRTVHPAMWVLATILVLYFVFVRARL